MRWVHVAIVALFALSIVVFAFQNLEMITMNFLGFSMSAPLALVAVLVYAIGAFTGGSLYSMLRKSIRESQGTF